jgi:hypothetical protein
MDVTFTKIHGNADSRFIKPAPGIPGLPEGTKQQKWTDTIKVLGPGLSISYRARPDYPTQGQVSAVIAGVEAARTILREAVAQMDQVVFFRRPEGKHFSNIMNYHFGLAADRRNGNLIDNVVDKPFGFSDIGKKDRRWALNLIREGMLSLSFHLNTGVYLIDCDNDNRTIQSGFRKGAAGQVVSPSTRGYVSLGGCAGMDKSMLSAWRNGEIHVAFKLLADGRYSPEHYARVIIHEAAHKYLGVIDVKYAWATTDYANLPFIRCIDNADCYAWAALSLAAGELVHGKHGRDDTRMPAPIEPQAAAVGGGARLQR